MAGNPGNPDIPDSNSEQSNPPPERVVPPAPPPKPTARTFSCTKCGAPVTVKYPGASLSAVCSGCHSTIDITDRNYEILSTYNSKFMMGFPEIPLGTRGKLRGKTWECIGFMVRTDVASRYYWFEYLLFNPYYGYRWLIDDKGHWMFVNTIKRKPEIKSAVYGFKSAESAILEDTTYRLYNKGEAKVNYVIGEFYWRVVIGDVVNTADYINPPKMLSTEYDGNERVWSIAEFIDIDEVAEAFNLKGKLSKAHGGIGALEPSKATAAWKKIWPFWALFITFITCAQIYFAGTAKNETATTFYGNFIPNQKVNDVTIPKFILNKNSANVQIVVAAPVSNSWFWVSGELVNNQTGASYPFEMTCEYYYGTDSDGAWSEGSHEHDVDFSSVPGGEYYINIDAESGDFKDLNEKQYTLSVRRDVPLYWNWLWFGFFLSVMPFYCWCMMRRDEVSRWSNSDYSPYVSNS